MQVVSINLIKFSVYVASQAPSGAGATGGRYHPDQRSQQLRPAPPPAVLANPVSVSGSSAYNTASSNQGGQSTSSSKLPHGLTVHELKEMTKARLQAEAAEKMPGDENANGNSMGMERGPSSPFNGASSNSFQPVPLQSQSMLPEQTSYYHQPAEVSPSPAFHTHHHQSTPLPYDNASQDPNRAMGNQYRTDSYTESNWENASVTSHNSTVASDYLGSESAFSSGVGGGFSQAGDDQPGLSLNRTQSYPIPSRESTPTSLPSPLASSYFDSSAAAAALASNRQRAMTLSPRPGLSLLHEDRPGFSDDALGIPSFSSSSRQARQQLPTRPRRSFSPIMQPQGYVSDGFAGGFGSNSAGVIGGVVYENRPRTSSAVSLPTISHTAEEFALDGYGGGIRSSDGVNIGGSPIQEHDALSLTGPGESLMSTSSFYGSGDMRSTSSVFRDEYGGISAPPGLGSSAGLTGSFMNPLMARTGSMDGNGSDNNRVRASTWVAGGDIFGTSSNLYESTVDDTLAGDLASILKLSGAEEKDDTFSGKPSDFGGSLY